MIRLKSIVTLIFFIVCSHANAFWPFSSSEPTFKGPYAGYESCAQDIDKWMAKSDDNRMTRDRFYDLCSKWVKTPQDRCLLFRSDDPKWEETIQCVPELSAKGEVLYEGTRMSLCAAIGCEASEEGKTAFQADE